MEPPRRCLQHGHSYQRPPTRLGPACNDDCGAECVGGAVADTSTCCVAHTGSPLLFPSDASTECVRRSAVERCVRALDLEPWHGFAALRVCLWGLSAHGPPHGVVCGMALARLQPRSAEPRRALGYRRRPSRTRVSRRRTPPRAPNTVNAGMHPQQCAMHMHMHMLYMHVLCHARRWPRRCHRLPRSTES